MEKRLSRGDQGINPLDAACREHDIAYTSKNSKDRYEADKKLQKAAMNRIFSKNTSVGERATAAGVALAMKVKRSLTKKGKGMKANSKSSLAQLKAGTTTKTKKARQVKFDTLIKNAKAAIRKSQPSTVKSAIKVSLDSVKRSKNGQNIKKPRIIKVPTYSGGVLPLIPIFAGLSALGSIAGGASGIVIAINHYRNSQKQFDENRRHNETMEAIAIGNHKKGNGFYLQSNNTGKGFYLASYPKN